MTEVLIAIEGLDTLKFIPEMTENVEQALTMSLNTASAKSRTIMDRKIREQIAFPASYLRPSSGRLIVTKKATANSLSTEITGRGRATSLARFSKQKPLADGNRRHRGGSVNVQVKKGGSRKAIQRAFLIRLQAGTDGPLSNVGLAVRTDGAPPVGAYRPKQIGKNLWLLYGPSVDQALISATGSRKGVVEEMTPEMLDFLNDEFNRQLDRLEAKDG